MRGRIKRLVVGAMLLAGGMGVGTLISSSNLAQAQLRSSPQPQAFQSGGQLSVPLLREIAATLQQIDSRLSRMEAIAQRLQADAKK